jgi:hypothetical protein
MNYEKVNSIEGRLKSRLKLRQPDPVYVRRLKNRLTTMPSIELEYPKTKPEVYIAAVAAVSGIAVLLLVIRKLLQK